MEPSQASKELSIANATTNAASVPSNRTPRVDTSNSTVITPDTLSAPTPIKVPPAPVSTATAGMQGVLESAQGETDTFLADLTKSRETAQTGKNNALEQYLSTLMAPGEIQQTAQAYAQKGGVDDIQKELDAVNNKILTEQNALRRRIEAIQKMGGGLASGAGAEIENLERESLAKQADLYVIQMGVQGRFDSAKTIADRAVAAQLEVQRQKQDILGLIYQENKEQFTKAEQREFETKQADRNRKIEEEAANKKSMYELAIQAQMDGAPTSVVEQMLASKTKEEALVIGGSYLGALDREAKRASISASYASAAASRASTRNSLITAAKSGDTNAIKQLGFDPRSSSTVGEYTNIIDTASLLVGAERGQETRRAMAAAVERGDFQTTYSMIANNVQSALQGDSASRFGAARTDIQVLGGLRDSIQEFERAGGDTGFLKGSADEIARKFGQLVTDPQFASLAVQLEREFQAYRQQMTGAAFGASESADYEKVNPSSKKSLELNLATIDGALRQLENRVVGTTEAYVPGSREIYDLATGREKVISTTSPEKEPIGAVLEIGGVRYRKVGADAYEQL
jgi:hypothetical protein